MEFEAEDCLVGPEILDIPMALFLLINELLDHPPFPGDAVSKWDMDTRNRGSMLYFCPAPMKVSARCLALLGSWARNFSRSVSTYPLHCLLAPSPSPFPATPVWVAFPAPPVWVAFPAPPVPELFAPLFWEPCPAPAPSSMYTILSLGFALSLDFPAIPIMMATLAASTPILRVPDPEGMMGLAIYSEVVGKSFPTVV